MKLLQISKLIQILLFNTNYSMNITYEFENSYIVPSIAKKH